MEDFAGYCVICRADRRFTSPDGWYRDHLRCAGCDSIPRERALIWALDLVAPDWRALRLHECSPADRPPSRMLATEAPGYVASQFFPAIAPGTWHQGHRCEDLEALSFSDQSLDLHVHLDVMEHLNRPDRACREMLRTLVPGGKAVFTVPVYDDAPETTRQAIRFPDGVEHLQAPEYHGNPVDEDGALVMFRFGRDFMDLLRQWAPGFGVNRLSPQDAALGLLGAHLDVFVLTRREVAGCDAPR